MPVGPIPPAPQPASPAQPEGSTSKQVKREYGVGVVLLIVAGIIAAAVVLGLFMLALRRSWGATHPPTSRRRVSQ